MIDIYDLIEALGASLNKNFILHRSMKKHPKFKIYKIFEYSLYQLNKDKTKELLYIHSFNINAPSEEIDNTWKDCDKKYISILFNWVYNEFRV